MTEIAATGPVMAPAGKVCRASGVIPCTALSVMQMAFRRPTRSERRLAELSALADGSITPRRRAALEQRLARSPELRAALERERAAVALVREARAGVRAPERLRASLEARRAEVPRPRRVPMRATGALSTAAAAAIVVLAIVLAPGGAPGAPTVAQAAALGLRGAQAPAPRPDPRRPGSLTAAVGPVAFPDLADSLRWIATGERSDRLDGHRAVTVLYRSRGEMLAYTIVSVPALRQPAGRVTPLDGIALRALRVRGRTVVTWRRDGRTCVLSSAQASAGALEQLAAYTSSGD